MATGAHAADWRLTPSVTGSAIYTDNVNQSATNPEDALILTVTPGFSLQSEGSRRVQASLSYSLTGVQRFSENDSTDLHHNLGAVGNAELVEDLLFLDATAGISQVLISLFGSPADATINDTNRDTVGSYSLSPYIKKRFGSYADGTLRYTFGGALYDKTSSLDATVDVLTANLSSGDRFNNLSWALDYSNRKADNKGLIGESTFEEASATLGFALTRHFRLTGTYGEEWNDFLGAAPNATEGSFYSVGFGWTPSRRTSIDLSVGERYGNRTYSLAASHRTAASGWHASYSENLSDIADQLLKVSVFWVCDGRLFETSSYTPPAGQTSCVGPLSRSDIERLASTLNIPRSALFSSRVIEDNGGVTLAGGVYLLKNLNVGVTWTRRQLDLGLSVFDTQRISQTLAGSDDRTQGITGSVSYRLTPLTSANGALTLSHNSATDVLLAAPQRDDDLLTLSLGLDHEFSRDLSGALIFRHQQRDSSIAISDFDENSLTGLLDMRF